MTDQVQRIADELTESHWQVLVAVALGEVADQRMDGGLRPGTEHWVPIWTGVDGPQRVLRVMRRLGRLELVQRRDAHPAAPDRRPWDPTALGRAVLDYRGGTAPAVAGVRR